MHPEQVYDDAQNHQTRALAQRKFVRGNGVYVEAIKDWHQILRRMLWQADH
jgi:hypothetical protein